EINIEHVGSTSVQGMSAKSIIDIDIVYMKSEAFESIKKSLGAIGYYHNGNQEIEGREVFKRISNSGHAVLDRISHHLYVCHKENAELRRHLLFRDHLRSNENARNQYKKIKLDLAVKANQDKKTYALLKEEAAADFIKQCIENEEKENGK
ncbi:MAG: GrpB family protein, partial [Ekhidna sp.]